MEFLVNDLSVHGQFPSVGAFVESLRQLLGLRKLVEHQRLSLRTTRRFLDRPVARGLAVRDVINGLSDKTLKLQVIDWLGRKGPFWDDDPLHGPDDWFECPANSIVTEAAVAEAAIATARGLPRGVISAAPSDWLRAPLVVDWVRGDETRSPIEVENHWHEATLRPRLVALQRPVTSWTELGDWARRECPRLHFAHDFMQPLAGQPFVFGAANRIQVLLMVLDRLMGSFTAQGPLTTEGMRLYQDYFSGDKARFTDSSDAEKDDFKSELTFPHPERPGEKLFCPWHGKVKTPQIRIHFSGSTIRHDQPLYVVYIGPKITKR